MVQALPGVARPPFVLGEFAVRGIDGAFTEFYLDGVRCGVPFHMSSHKKAHNAEGISSTTFYPGGFGAKRGNAIGGVIELEGRVGRDGRWHGLVDINPVDAMAQVEGPVGRHVTVPANARMSHIDRILTAIQESPALSLPYTVTPRYWDYVVRTDLALRQHRFFTMTHGLKGHVAVFYPRFRGGSPSLDGRDDRLDGCWLYRLATGAGDWEI